MAFRDGIRTCVLCRESVATDDIEDVLLFANCLATDQVGDCIHITGPKVGIRLQVTKVDITDRTTMPSIGIIVEKTSDTKCIIQTEGDYVESGLTAGSLYYVGHDARITDEIPEPPLGGIALVQIMGEALDDEKLLLRPELDLVEPNDARFALGISFIAACLATDLVGHYVYITASRAVTKVNISDSTTMPSVGQIIEKSSDTICRVQTIGELITGETLIPGARYWIGDDSRLLPNPPSVPPSEYRMAQVVGVALEEHKLILRPDMQAVKLTFRD